MLQLHQDSHLDHNLPPELLAAVLKRFQDRTGFFLETFDLPEGMALPCGLFGPILGDPAVPEDEVLYQRRGGRSYRSRLVCRPPRPAQQVTVIAGPHEGHDCILFTLFAGPATPREPGDPDLQGLSEQVRRESQDFWAEHALALSGG